MHALIAALPPFRRFPWAAVLLAFALLPACVAPASATSTPAPAGGLQRELDRLVAPFDGKVGAYVLDLRSGRGAQVNGDAGFPMASTVKVPVAVHILALVDEGRLDLRQQVVLQAADIYPAMGGPMDTHLSAGSAITVRDLLHMMLTVSDNNATDILIRLGGGPAAVDARMRALGIGGIRVDRYIWEMLAHSMGELEVSADRPISHAGYAALDATVRSIEEQRRFTGLYNADPRDTSTPAGMAALLRRIWEGRALRPDTTAVLKTLLLDCRTGQARLKGMLPDATPVAHKTGTVDEVINDVGVIALPGGRGEVVVAVYLVSGASDQARDRMIAQVARAAYDYFLFVPQE
jgi:beta-lactamase class A